MRIVKGVISLILALALLFTAGLTMGLNAAEKAISADVIQKAMTNTAMVEDLVADALADSAAIADGVYDDLVQDVLGSEAMTEYLSGYLASSLASELYGEESGEIFNEDQLYNDLINSFSQELEGFAGLEGYEDIEDIGYLQQALESELPGITAELDDQINGYESAGEEMIIGSFLMNEELQAMMAKGFRTLLTAISVILAVAIIVLGWRSKLGLLWCSIVMGALSMLYVTLSLMGEFVAAIIGVSENESILVNMLTEGFGESAGTGFVITAVLLAAFIILKIIDKRRNRYEKDFKTSERYA